MASGVVVSTRGCLGGVEGSRGCLSCRGCLGARRGETPPRRASRGGPPLETVLPSRYAFALNAWEMLSLSRPFSGLDGKEHRELVCYPTHERPRLPRAWDGDLREALRSAWAPKARDRPPMDSVHEALREVHGRVRAAREGKKGMFARVFSSNELSGK